MSLRTSGFNFDQLQRDIAEWLIEVIEQFLKDIDNNYEIWVIDEAVDCACTKWNGVLIPKSQSYPTPILDTHPNCRCQRVKPEVYAQLGPSIRSLVHGAFP